MSWRLRRAGEADLDAVMALETASFLSDAWSRESMAREIVHPYGYYLVAFSAEAAEDAGSPDIANGGLAGYAGLLCPPRSEFADIQTIAVAPGARGHGLGRQLMGRLIGEAAARGAASVLLEVRADNPVAEALYRSLGFTEIARRPAYYQPDGVDAIVMQLPLPEPAPAFAEGAAP
jgi:ribosomal-protein-alanine N-acetyltransferase